MKILSFSDWRVQSIEKLLDYIKTLDQNLDVIIYAGDDISRFNNVRNYFEELASHSKYGLFAVAGNDEFLSNLNLISGKKVYDIFKEPVVIENYVFVGIEGATIPPGNLLHSEKEVSAKLNKALKDFSKKELIIVSHAPPNGILDVGIRYGVNNIGSTALRTFIDKNYKKIKIVFCGHVHSQGGNEETYKGVKIVNCASHDNEGAQGNVYLIDLLNAEHSWDYITEEGCISKEIRNLEDVPLIGGSRAKNLFDNNIKTIEQLANCDSKCDISKLPNFRGGMFELVKNYAKAILLNKPIVLHKPAIFETINANSNIYFFDAEYNPEGTKAGPFGIFLLGILDTKGHTKQFFVENPKEEKKILKKFRSWLISEKPVLISYSSSSADKPQLMNAFKRFNISTEELENSFFDLYYDCINTQKIKEQAIFLPMKSSMSVKEIAISLGYKKPKETEIKWGIEALCRYKEFLSNNDIKIKKDLLEYNESDLKETKFVFDVIDNLVKEYEKNKY